jgi:predicted ATPase/DNA-binding SARP family transcriptional activator
VYNEGVYDLSISLFGSPQIKRGDQALSIQRRKDLALLVYLVVTSQPHSRDTLATLLWPEQSQAGARSNLRKSLSRLRAQLGEDCLIVSQTGAGLNPNLSLHLDTARFDLNIREYREHGHRRNGPGPHLCANCQKSLQEAAQLYSADFLEGFHVPDSSVFEEWQFFRTDGLRRNLAEVLEQLTNQLASIEEFEAAIEYCRRWLALDRLRESPHRQLMLLYALSGQQAAAIRQFDECKQLLKKELDADPEPETLQLHEAIKKDRVHKAWGSSQSKAGQVTGREPGKSSTTKREQSVHNLPANPAPFIGRKKELDEIGRILMEPACRLLTLLGPGGNGKTRLAVEFASTIHISGDMPFKDGIWFIALAPLSEKQSIVSAMTDCLQIGGHLKGSDARKKLLEHLSGRQILLVLDNFEHLLSDDNLQLVSDLLTAAPLGKVLTTSRERLDVQGETIFRVEGLETPTEELFPSSLHTNNPESTFSALQFFEQCASRIQPSFRISESNYMDVSQICRKVQGMPLAIELAASWLELLSLREINTEIAKSVDFLESTRRDLPDRQRSLRAVFDSSWTMLDRQTRPVLKALSVFRTGFTREAAQAVAGASAKTLLVLTNKSWIQRLSNGRYQIHELLKQFTLEKLAREKATFEQVQKQFCEYYSDYSLSMWEMMKGPQQRQAFSGIDSEFENIQTAWAWMADDGNLEHAIDNMLPILVHYCESRGKVFELTGMLEAGLRVLEGQAKNVSSRRMEVFLRTAQGSFHYDGFPLRLANFDGLFPIDLETVRQAWSLAQRFKFHELGFWGILLAYIYGRLIDLDEGVKKLKQMIPAFEEKNMPWELANTCLHLVKLLNYRRENPPDVVKAMSGYLSQATGIFTGMGDIINAGYTSSQWGEMKVNEDDLQGAVQQWKEAHSSLLAAGEWSTATDIMWRMADVYLQLGSFQEAFDCYQEIAQNYFEHNLREHAVSALSKESFEKVRYGDMAEALQLRQQCLDLLVAGGPEYQVAWNSWEMGELMRVLGRPEDAREWYERSHKIFENYNDEAGESFYFRGLGDIALKAGDYKAALAAFSKSAKLAEDSKHTWTIIYALTGLGRSAMGLDDRTAAQKHLEQAASLTIRARDKGIALVVTGAFAALLASKGKSIHAVELAALVQSHFASWQETKKQASSLLESERASLPKSKFNQAVERGCSLDVWVTIRSLTPQP